jgi:glycosyltransferase involved in cell wall biosynthesis
MRVLYCTDTYPPQVNGVSVVTALSVAGLRERGWECAIVAPRYPNDATSVFSEYAEDEGVTAIPSISIPIYPDIRFTIPSYGAVYRVAHRFKPDLIHSETEFIQGRLGQLVGARLGIPLVSSYHTDFARYTDSYGMPWLRGTIERYITRFHRRSRRTYTPSAPAREDLLRWGIRDVEVWGRGVDITTYSPRLRSDALRAERGLANRFTFLYVGRLAHEKNVEQIVEAYRVALPSLPADSTRLVIAGAGPREAALRAAAPPSVIFLGYLDRRTELPALYASADAFVFASLTETLGLVVLEAMASGLPVIATPAGGVADHLRDGQNGIAYPANDARAMADAMIALASNPTRARALALAARATAEALSWDHELDRLDTSYREVVDGVGSATPAKATTR